jgi:hypothetical protein
MIMRTSIHNLRNERPRPGDQRIDRASIFGNPFVIGRDGTRGQVIAKFEERERARLAIDPGRRSAVRDLHGKRLFCWCSPLPCHGDVLARLAAELAAADADKGQASA